MAEIHSKIEARYEEGVPDDICSFEQLEDPCVLVIFGATGDLTSRKLFPALYTLLKNGGLPDPLVILGVGRTKLTDEAFRERMRASLEAKEDDLRHWKKIVDCIFYQPIDFAETDSRGGSTCLDHFPAFLRWTSLQVTPPCSRNPTEFPLA